MRTVLCPTASLLLAIWTAASAAGTANADEAAEAGANAPYSMVSQIARRIVGRLSVHYRVDGEQPISWTVVAPVPPMLPSQPDIQVECEPEGVVVADLTNASRKLVRMELTGKREIVVQARYKATLAARELTRQSGKAADNVPMLSDTERTACLGTDSQCDWKSPRFAQWIKASGMTRAPGESQIDFGRRVFLFIKRRYTYTYYSKMDRRASVVCHVQETDCGGFSALFVSILRAGGVPARQLVGRWAYSTKPGARLGDTVNEQQHVKCEFFAAGVGWIPIDLSSAVLSDKTTEGLQYFGRDPGDFVTAHVDCDIQVDSRGSGIKSVIWMQDFALWVNGPNTPKLSRVLQWTVE